jgi:hypothetical protein
MDDMESWIRKDLSQQRCLPHTTVSPNLSKRVKTDTYLEAPKRTVKLGIPVKILMIASSSRGRGKYPGKREKVCMDGICDFSYASLISYYSTLE